MKGPTILKFDRSIWTTRSIMSANAEHSTAEGQRSKSPNAQNAP